MHRKPTVIGWREHVALPELGLDRIDAKIDTGARTTALHASRIRIFERDGEPWVEFHPEHDRLDDARLCRLRLHDRRAITNTSGVPQDRVIIRTRLLIAGHRIRIEVSLADRADMTFPIIIGRSALRRARLLVDSGRSWLTTPAQGD
ncbi:ATP-dependent zinc protease family protein [Sinisalibacter lacisalsi]|uniref:Ribosomal protein S6 modification protein n=1 Tax=Sinisalibacter lacisalsi TaxID=1526570 RepID=A0ABQ1QKE1_9RHOB|nr:RimK/LysX family protein [Sinisalibacter lacisalsi]GGD31233.1 ribosomal protein S6 modification protein [Sinisalibacter lacisalsi]